MVKRGDTIDARGRMNEDRGEVCNMTRESKWKEDGRSKVQRRIGTPLESEGRKTKKTYQRKRRRKKGAGVEDERRGV